MNVMERSKQSVGPKDPLAGEIIDCDIHAVLPSGLQTIFPYLDKATRQRLEAKGVGVGHSALSPRLAVPNGGSAIRPDAKTPDGGAGGSDLDFIVKDLIEPHGIEAAVCSCIQSGAMATVLAGPDESVSITRAFNDFFLEEWGLKKKGSVRYALTVPVQIPEEAAKEIRRAGGEEGVAAVFMPLLNIPMGNRHYHPIYDAAQEMGLPILLHVTGTENVYHGSPVVAGGWPESYAERYVSLSQVGEANLISLVFSGVLERFPDLKVLFVEFGCGWILPTMWRMNKAWRGVRFDVPWVKKSPVDYINEHVRISTQPLDEPERPDQLKSMIDLIGDHLLCFATDYPHWDNDMPGMSLRMLSDESRRKIFVDNAKGILRL